MMTMRYPDLKEESANGKEGSKSKEEGKSEESNTPIKRHPPQTSPTPLSIKLTLVPIIK